MSRPLLLAVLSLVSVLVAVVLVGVLAVGVAPTRDGTIPLDGLEGPVSLGWSDTSGTSVEATTAADLATGIGYAHGLDHAWTLVFWRDAAQGTLSERSHTNERVLDRHARQIGFAETARQTYLALPSRERALLDGYARGVNQAFADPGVAQGDAFVLLDLTPEPWEPWDALAVEALHAYLGTDPPGADSLWALALQTPEVDAFVRVDSLFRQRVGLGDAHAERAFTADLVDGRTLIAHKPTGTASLPAFAPMTLRLGGRSAAVLTVPGTLLFPAGAGPGAAWSVLRTSTLRIEPFLGTAPPRLYSRLVEPSGDERLLSARRDASGLVLGTVPTPSRDTAAVVESAPDAVAPPNETSEADTTASAPTAWRIVWPGFGAVSDLGSFQALLAGRLPHGGPDAFRLLDGDGLVATASAVRAVGAPRVAVQGERSALVTDDPHARAAAERLARLAATESATPDRLARDRVSTWARDLLTPMLDSLRARQHVDRRTEIPIQYLRSWRFDYAPEAIAPTLFETWIQAHEALTGAPPDLTDSLDVELLPYSLRIARAELRDRFGADPTVWRWERLFEPSRAPFMGRSQTHADRLAPAAAGEGGHATALRPGPAALDRFPHTGPAVWTFRVSIRDGRTFVTAPGTPSGPARTSIPSAHLPGFVLALDPAAPLSSRRLTLLPGT